MYTFAGWMPNKGLIQIIKLFAIRVAKSERMKRKAKTEIYECY